MSTEVNTPLKDSAIAHTLRILSEINAVKIKNGKPEKEAERLFKDALRQELMAIKAESEETKAH
jgi:hypothetical protein